MIGEYSENKGKGKMKEITGIVLGIGIVCVVLTGCATDGNGTVERSVNGLPLLFQDDFEQGAAHWEPVDPSAWKIVNENGNHVYALYADSHYEPPVRSPHAISLVKGLTVSDCIIEAKLKQTGRDYGHRDMCIFLDYQDPSHFYYVHIATHADAHANSIFLVNGAPRVSIATERTEGTDWGRGVYHTVRVTRCTKTGFIKVYFDDMEHPIMVAKDRHFLSGRVGFGSFDDRGNVDDVRIWGKRVK